LEATGITKARIALELINHAHACLNLADDGHPPKPALICRQGSRATPSSAGDP
jgi:hypothetical protein